MNKLHTYIRCVLRICNLFLMCVTVCVWVLVCMYVGWHDCSWICRRGDEAVSWKLETAKTGKARRCCLKGELIIYIHTYIHTYIDQMLLWWLSSTQIFITYVPTYYICHTIWTIYLYRRPQCWSTFFSSTTTTTTITTPSLRGYLRIRFAFTSDNLNFDNLNDLYGVCSVFIANDMAN